VAVSFVCWYFDDYSSSWFGDDFSSCVIAIKDNYG
jgi:hypothetical protein